MEPTNDVMIRIQRALARFDRDSSTIRHWRRACPALARSPVSVPSQLPSWVWQLPRPEADDVIGILVKRAQDNDEAALLATVVCLTPGLRNLVNRMPVSIDEVVAEAAIRILEFPLARRRKIAAGVVLDVRHALWAPACRTPQIQAAPVDPLAMADLAVAPGELGVAERSADEQLVLLVRDAWRAGHLDTDRARLLLETRVLGQPIQVAADKCAANRSAVYMRRARAEARLTDLHAVAA